MQPKKCAKIKTMKINPSIFKEYDIRGVYPDEINESAAYALGGVFAALLNAQKGDKIAVGRDGRKSSKPLAENFIKGVVDAGVDVIDIGKTTTPVMYFAVCSMKIAGGAMITASHNPAKYNGVKFCGAGARPIGGEEIKRAFEARKKPAKAGEKGEVREKNIKERYLKKIYGDFSMPKKLPFSYSFDKDADRLMLKDKKGAAVRGDLVGILIGENAAKKKETIVYDLRCSRSVPNYFRSRGIRAIPCKTGHLNIKNAMRKHKASFGMEITGHYYFKKLCYCESPDLALRKIIELIKETKKTPSQLLKPYEKYHHSGVINFKFEDGKKFEEICEKLKAKYENGAISFMDGITVEFSNWWFNLRRSRTEPLLRLAAEANSEELLAEKVKEIKEVVAG
ncbi:MAG: hypothetical protein GXP44_01830 [bacterium]|nr:hypothetical protein [bacterium]